MGDFLLVIIEHCSLGAFVLSQFTRAAFDRWTDRPTDAHGKDRFAYNGDHRLTFSHNRGVDVYRIGAYQ